MNNPRTLMYAGGALGGLYLLSTQISDFRTPGVKNIENRHTAAGAGPNHTPAHASPLGRDDLSKGAQVSESGPGSPKWQENHGNQSPESGELAKKFNRTQYGGENNKTGSN